METPLYELYDRVEQVGKEPGYKEWQQYAAQVVNEQEDGNDKQSCSNPSDKAVKCDGLFFHFLLI